MNRRIAIPLALMVLAGCMVVPIVSDVSDAAEQSFYGSQLDGNGTAVFDALETLRGNYQNTVTIDVPFDLEGSTIHDSSESAVIKAESVVADALAAKYYSEPLIPHLWDLPVSSPEVTVKVTSITLSGNSGTYYYASSVSVVLTVPEDMMDDPSTTDKNELEQRMDQVKNAVKDVSATGSNTAEKVKSIVNGLSGIKTVDDEEGTVSNIYDALVEKKSSSIGISSAFTSCCMLKGIDAVSVRGQLYDGTESSVHHWNAVLCDGVWYGVDADLGKHSKSYIMAGSLTQLDAAGSTFGGTHVADLDMSEENGLVAPGITRDAYQYPDDTPFFEKYGAYIILAAIILVICVAMFRATRDDGH